MVGMANTSEYTLISADSHVIEPGDLFEKRLPKGVLARAPKIKTSEDGSTWVFPDGESVALPVSAATGSGYRSLNGGSRSAVTMEEILPGMHDPAKRLRMQDQDSVYAEVLYPFPDLWDAIKRSDDLELKLACVRAYNDWIAEFSAHNPDRLIGIGKLPSTTPEDVREEFIRCTKELNLRGVLLEAWPTASPDSGEGVDDEFWAMANEARVPISIHYGLGLSTPTSPPTGIAPGLTPPMSGAALPLTSSGTFDRYPNIQLVFAHGNAGWAMHWLEFMDIQYIRSVASRKYTLARPDSVPSDYIRRHFWFTFHLDRAVVRNRAKLGIAHLMWASHLPLDNANWPDNREQAMRVTEEVPSEDRRALLYENTARLYRLPGYEAGFSGESVDAFERLMHF
jgi:predicted TIM-barrel fold metal-dependent hydrolase